MEKRIRSRKAKWFVLGALALAGVILWNRLAPDEVQKRLDQIREAGWPVDGYDLNVWYAEPPYGENAADYFLQAIAARVSPPKNATNLPFLGRASLPDPNAPFPGPMRQSLMEFIPGNRKAIDLLHQGAALDESRFPIDLTQGFNTLLPHLSGIKESALLLMMDGLSNVEQGLHDQAAQSFRTAVRMADLTDQEPILISHLVANACRFIACDFLNWWLNYETPPAETLVHLKEFLIETEQSMKMKEALIGEQSMGVHLFQSPAKVLVNFVNTAGNGKIAALLSVSAGSVGDFIKKFVIGVVRTEDFVFYLDSMNRYLDSIQEPFPKKISHSTAVANLIADRRSAKPWSHIISDQCMVPVDRLVLKEAKSLARLHSAQTALALELFRIDHGRLPGTLNELAPDYLEKPLQDPFTGEPLRYLHDGSAYVIYSLGPDGKDAHRTLPFDEFPDDKAIEDDISFFVK